MEKNTKILTVEEEKKLRQPIDEYVGNIQKKIDALRADGIDKVISLQNKLDGVKRDRSLTQGEKENRSAELRSEIAKAKTVEGLTDAEKEEQQSLIDRTEVGKRDCEASLAETERRIASLETEIEQKEARRRELDRAVAQSSVFQEEEKLQQEKRSRQEEQARLGKGLQSLALEIRREAVRLSSLCNSIGGWEEEEELVQVRRAAEAAQKAYAARSPSLSRLRERSQISIIRSEVPLTGWTICWRNIEQRRTRRRPPWPISARMSRTIREG